LKARWLAFPVLLVAGFASWLCFKQLENELAPKEDRSRLRINATAPEGATFDYMSEYMDQLSDRVASEVPEATMILAQTAPGFGGSGSVEFGFDACVPG
jgi:multidrug efflux pump